ncbi:MAG: hypothetical protein COC10_05100 [Sphingobium sp.]|nr:MAG: hypothetical protein COC10_05100 [Sphingobium sp.]
MAKQKDNGGCSLAVICLLVIIAVGQCSKGSESDTEAPDLDPISASSPSSIMYVVAASLNCRANPTPGSTVVEKLQRGAAVSAGVAQGTWVHLDRLGSDCWVAQRFLSESPPEPEPVNSISPAHSASRVEALTSRKRGTSGGGCGIKWKCGQMDSCSEAYHYLNDCGVGRLDGDGDGVPCESIC